MPKFSFQKSGGVNPSLSAANELDQMRRRVQELELENNRLSSNPSSAQMDRNWLTDQSPGIGQRPTTAAGGAMRRGTAEGGDKRLE